MGQVLHVSTTKNIILKAENIRVFSVTTAREVLECVRKRNINVGIIDINLKDIEGYKVVPLVKDINNDIKIILTTRKNSPKLESKCREVGIIYYAIKPFDYDEILKTIKIAIKSDFKKIRGDQI